MSRSKYAPIGSVIENPDSDQDLIDACVDILRDLSKRKANKLNHLWEKSFDGVGCDWENMDDGKHHSEDCDSCKDERQCIVNETIFDMLSEYAPPFFYFGVKPGRVYGFWMSEDEIRDAIFDKEMIPVDDLSEIEEDHKNYYGYILLTNDHGNQTLYWRNKAHRLKFIWGVV